MTRNVDYGFTCLYIKQKAIQYSGAIFANSMGGHQESADSAVQQVSPAIVNLKMCDMNVR